MKFYSERASRFDDMEVNYDAIQKILYNCFDSRNVKRLNGDGVDVKTEAQKQLHFNSVFEFVSPEEGDEASVYYDVARNLKINDVVWDGLLRTIKLGKSPGIPFMYEFSTNAALLEADPLGLRLAVTERLVQLIDDDTNVEEIYNGPSKDYLAEKLRDQRISVMKSKVDPVKVFVKPEFTGVHKPGRMIFSKSLVDALVVRLLIYPFLQADKERWLEGYSSIGIDLTNEELMREFYDHLFRGRRDGRILHSDLQGFDWSFREFCYMIYANLMHHRLFYQFGFEMGSVPESHQWWVNAFTSAIAYDLKPILILSDGTILQLERTVMLSGAAWTAQADTEVRSVLPEVTFQYAVGGYDTLDESDSVVAAKAVANGDDCGEEFHEDYYEDSEIANTIKSIISNYENLGFVMKSGVISKYGEPVSFCSQVITPNTSYPESWTKSVCNLLNRTSVSTDLWDQFRYVYKRAPGAEKKFDFLLDILRRELPQSQEYPNVETKGKVLEEEERSEC